MIGPYKALDLFCGAGGASMGLHRAGFDVTGVDIKSQPRYPFRFIQGDAMEFPLDGFDFIWASPPCQGYAQVTAIWREKRRGGYPDLIASTRERLQASGTHWVIENVHGSPLRQAIFLCGLSFNLPLIRHRFFESSIAILSPPHKTHKRGMALRREIYTVAGHDGGKSPRQSNGSRYRFANYVEAKLALGIEWMTRLEMSQAIPPAYSEYIGKQARQVVIGE